MDRRTLLLGASAIMLAGCSRVEPGPANPQPSATPTPRGARIGVEQTRTGTVLGALFVGAMAKEGDVAQVQATPASEVVAALQNGTLAAAPVWASTVWAELSDAEDLPDDVLADLAGLLQPAVTVLQPGLTDGGLVWMAAASSGQKSLEDLAEWSKGKAAAVPAMAIDRTDGLGALNAVYRTNFHALTLEDSVARAAAVANGQAGVGAFRRTEYLGGAQLVELIDPDQICISDQLVLLANSAYADASPNQVLAVNTVVQALTTADLVAMNGQLAQGASADKIARDWLASH